MSKTIRKRDRRTKPRRRKQSHRHSAIVRVRVTGERASDAGPILRVQVEAERERSPPRVEMWKAYPPHDETN
jgi:hypothetical protein